ncbi:MAG: AbrB/MazE/SpoVT family DNA-binding domain-containing protein [Algicola sp.]|nr:AbrB/MazE/SpoVT family DNA-binding domain-containing protein [Algicola sp.]
MKIAKVSSRGRVTIPKAIRDILSLKGGDELAFIDFGSHIGLSCKNNELDDLAGAGAPHSDVVLTVELMNKGAV